MPLKKIQVFVLLTASFFLSISCKQKKELSLTDGSFIGKGAGRNGPIEVEVTIQDKKIQSAKIKKEEETPDIGLPAEQIILDSFVKNGGQTNKIDVISGATITSNAVITALNSALDSSNSIIKAETVYADSECDIVIIGAGGAGLTAATEAASKGARVIVLEKLGYPGGNTSSSTGGLNASGTLEQKIAGITDSNEQFFEDTMKGGHYKNDEALVHTLVDNSAAIVEWLKAKPVSADLSDVGLMGGSTNRRTHRPVGGQAIGVHLVPKLYDAAKRSGAEIRLNNTVTDILKEGDAAVGVTVRNDAGTYTIRSKAVIIATGGFGANPQMIGKYRPELQNFPTTNVPGTTGDAFAWVEKFDAQLNLMSEIQIHPSVLPGKGILITEAVRGNGAIMITKTGRRFVNELETRDFTSKAILDLPEKSAYIFFDEDIRKSLKAIDSYYKAGYLISSDTLVNIAAKLGINAGILINTIKEYNAAQSCGIDTEFGRKDMARPILTPPFYAVEIEPAIHHTMGGILINTKAEVQTKSGNSVPGLYAAGEVTGGVHGDNRLGGNAIADITTFGKIAADSALEYIASK